MMKQKIRTQAMPHIILFLVAMAMMLPLLLLFMSSITDESTLILNGYSFFPEKFSLEAYGFILAKKNTVFRAYGITILVTTIGTVINLIISSLLAYPLSVTGLPGKRFFSFFVFFTMLFNGGLVPSYLIWSGVFHIKNTLLALLLPNLLMSAMNVVLIRTFFSTGIPPALYEAAQIDGASQFTIFRKIVLPLGKPILVTIGLFSGLGYWNDWGNGLYYLTDTRMYGIQNFLNRMITDSQFLLENSSLSSGGMVNLPATSVKMAIAFVAIIPIIIIYPFLQKYFQNGIALGAVKG